MRITLLELSRLGFVIEGEPDPDRVPTYLSQNLLHYAGEVPCTVPAPPHRVSAPEGWVRYEWNTNCSNSGTGSIRSSLLLSVAPSHLHFARIHVPDGPARERVLSERDPAWALSDSGGRDAGSSATSTTVPDYLRLGVEHILSGWDHLAFVVALILLATSLGEVARLITGFTLAHSVTLALAVLGVLNPETAAIEALIGFSIALVAAENAWLMSGRGLLVPGVVMIGLLTMVLLSLGGDGMISSLTLSGIAVFSACHFALLSRVARPAGLRVAVAFAFGLIHGFGFAGVLAEMALPTERLAAALFGFNVGVEIGQLGVVALIWPLLWMLQRWQAGRIHHLVAEVGSAVICGLGVYWFVSRAFV